MRRRRNTQHDNSALHSRGECGVSITMNYSHCPPLQHLNRRLPLRLHLPLCVCLSALRLPLCVCRCVCVCLSMPAVSIMDGSLGSGCCSY
ncbi:hypothetical protein FQA47_007939 [Oryzias melastigma]|uniref:Uncharacterized protein n=1 Tax=Oryzias melastigma TaxID=30732 RepID=A0A834CA15_ORYME|nr:hypothetical protein FQA47_007939 [Oryzias melastigma]